MITNEVSMDFNIHLPRTVLTNRPTKGKIALQDYSSINASFISHIVDQQRPIFRAVVSTLVSYLQCLNVQINLLNNVLKFIEFQVEMRSFFITAESLMVSMIGPVRSVFEQQASTNHSKPSLTPFFSVAVHG